MATDRSTNGAVLNVLVDAAPLPGANLRRPALRILVAACVALTALGVVRAEAPPRTHDIVSDDYFTIDVMSDLATAPDGTHTAFVLLRWDEASDQRNADLWVVAHADRTPRRLTFDKAADNHPAWSPDGRWIYFTSARRGDDGASPPHDGTTQVWRIGVDGRDLAPVTQVKDGVTQFELSHDGKSLYYVVGHEQVEDDWKDLREKFSKLTYGKGVVNFSQLWKLDLQSWRAEKLVDDQRVIGAFTVTPDERRIAMLTTPTEELITNEGRSRVDVYDAASGSIASLNDRLWREQAPSPYGWLESPAWSADGNALAFAVSFDGYPSEVFVARFTDAAVTIRKLDRHQEISIEPGGGLAWRGTSRDLLLKAEDRARARMYLVRNAGGDAVGETVMLTPGDVCVDRFDGPRDGTSVTVIMSGLNHPPDLFTFTADAPLGRSQRITRVNPQVDTWKLPSLQIVQWTSPDGTPVEGILELPPDHTPGQPLPMILELHGGPTAASLFRMRFWIYGRILMPAQGYALLTPNYRGSTGYGDRFMTELIGHKNDRDVADILAGVDAMVARGIADPERLGVMGWSNGGYLTNCLITRTTRFKAASSGAGVFDAAMQWATEDTPGHVINFQQGFPWDATERMIKASPMFAADRIRTPTIIHVGANDTRCPPGNSKALFRALHEYLHVPTELIIYPGEGHGLTKYTHRKAKMEWDLAWFRKYLRGDAATETPTRPDPEI